MIGGTRGIEMRDVSQWEVHSDHSQQFIHLGFNSAKTCQLESSPCIIIPSNSLYWIISNLNKRSFKTVGMVLMEYRRVLLAISSWRWVFFTNYSKIYQIDSWLVVWTPLKNISQLGWLFPIYGKIKNVPNHQPDSNIWFLIRCIPIVPNAQIPLQTSSWWWSDSNANTSTLAVLGVFLITEYCWQHSSRIDTLNNNRPLGWDRKMNRFDTLRCVFSTIAVDR